MTNCFDAIIIPHKSDLSNDDSGTSGSEYNPSDNSSDDDDSDEEESSPVATSQVREHTVLSIQPTIFVHTI